MGSKVSVFLTLLMITILFNCGCASKGENDEVTTSPPLENTHSEDNDKTEDEAVDATASQVVLEKENDGYTLSSIEMTKGECYDVFVYIDAYVPEDHALKFNVIEWVDTPERAAEIGIDYERDMPGGFYLYDEVVVSDTLPLQEDYCYNMLNETSPMTVEHEALYTFIDYMHEEGFSYPFKIRILNEKITKVEQVYMP